MKRKHIQQTAIAALLAAMTMIITAYGLHIPVGTGSGYIHLGDTVIYLAAALLPTPYALGAAALGGVLADIISGAAIWALPTAIIKALLVLPFTAAQHHLLCRRNYAAPIAAGFISITGYGIAGWILYGSIAAGLADLLPNTVQAAACTTLFFVAAATLDKMGFKRRLLQP